MKKGKKTEMNNKGYAFSKECVPKKIVFLFLNENKCCGYSKEPSQ